MEQQRVVKIPWSARFAAGWLLGGLLSGVLLGVAPGQAQEESHWEMYTPEGVEYRATVQPTTLEVGLPVPVEVPSAVTGTGQGKRLTEVVVVVSPGAGGRPAQGPADERVMALAEDEEGNLWVATADGLSRFDGTNWTTFTKEDGLGSNVVGDVALDSQGHLWTIGTGSVSRFDGQHWIRYEGVADGLDLAVAPNGDMWFAAAAKLYRFDGQDWWEYGPEDGIPTPGSVMHVEVDLNGTVWANIFKPELPVPSYELTSFSGQQWISYDIPEIGIHEDIRKVFVDRKNHIWIGTGKALLVYDGQGWRQYGRRFAQVESMVEDDKGRIWLDGFDGFGFLEGTKWTSVANATAGLEPRVLFFDRRGNLWVGSWLSRTLLKWPNRLLPTSIEASPSPGKPRSFQLFPNYPNPFNQETQIAFQLPRREAISLQVFGLSGQSVTTLIEGEYEAGVYQTGWNGRNGRGQDVASGLYLYRLTAGDRQATRKMSLIR